MYIFWLETKFVLTVYGITLKHARMYWDIKTDDWLLRRPLLVYGGTEGSKEQIANSKQQIGYFISYNGKKELKNFSISELNKLYLYPVTGSPSWITHNLFYKFNYNYFINFDFGIDNIFDIHYRTYSSGISAPGRNIRLGINLKFWKK